MFSKKILNSLFSHRSLTKINFSVKTIAFRYLAQNRDLSEKAVIKSKHYLDRIPKGTLKTMKLSEDIMTQVMTPELIALSNMFQKHGFELRMAGGPVRDLLVNKIPSDIDFATTATPDEMKAMFEKEQVRMINAKGEKHGTITARINDKENFEITTLRIDVVTDGRHAEVEFTKNWALDAGRRDLTINSMFLDFDGVVYDYFNGAEDLKNNKVCFVGEATQRIQEDYLRILRYFRFYGKIAQTSDEHDNLTLQSIQNNVEGLKKISGERIWTELKKIAQGNFAVELILKMISVDIGPYIGLPENPNVEELVVVNKRMKDHNLTPHPITLITALFRTEKEGSEFHNRLRLSAYERDLIQFLILHRNDVQDNSIRKYQRILILSKSKQVETRGWIEELLMYQGFVELLRLFKEWKPPKFPVSGHTLIENKVPAGRAMNKVILLMKEAWIESDFTANEDCLLSQLPQILDECNSNKIKN